MSDNKAAYWCDKYHELAAQSSKEIERLNDLVAMLHDALLDFNIACDSSICSGAELAAYHKSKRALSASSETVAKWEAGKLLPLQAKIDALMLEYCPEDMTTEQIDNWGKYQIPVDSKTQALIDRATKQVKE